MKGGLLPKNSAGFKRQPGEAYQPIVPPAVVAPPVPLDQSGSTLQLQEVGPETAAVMDESRTRELVTQRQRGSGQHAEPCFVTSWLWNFGHSIEPLCVSVLIWKMGRIMPILSASHAYGFISPLR
jgi:hypothetical protein